MYSRSLSMLLTAITVATCGAGCDLMVDRTTPNNPEIDPPKFADVAAEYAAGEWEERLGVDLPDELPLIRWFYGECMTWDYRSESGDCVTGKYISGDAWGEEEQIQVLWNENRSLAKGSLAHELLHYAIDRDGRRDKHHEGPEWEQVREVREGIAQIVQWGTYFAEH